MTAEVYTGQLNSDAQGILFDALTCFLTVEVFFPSEGQVHFFARRVNAIGANSTLYDILRPWCFPHLYSYAAKAGKQAQTQSCQLGYSTLYKLEQPEPTCFHISSS